MGATLQDASPTDRFERFMSDSDGVMWTIERDPSLRSTIVAVAVLDRSPAWLRLLESIDRAARAIPRFRQRVERAPFGLAPPRWVVERDFDLGRHVRRVVAPAPGDFGSVLDVAVESAMAGFDRRRPLWEFTLVDGLEDGRAALVQKLHHSVTDGVGAMRMALMLYDGDREPPERRDVPCPPEPEALTGAALVRDSLRFTAAQAARAAAGTAAAIGAGVPRLVRDPVGTARAGAELAASLGRVLAPVTETLSPVMRDRSTDWDYHHLEVPLDRVRAVAAHTGGTVNDVFVTAVVDGLRRYHEHHGAAVPELLMTMPVSYRAESDALGGNRIMPARLRVPLGGGDTAARLRQIADRCHRWRQEPALPVTNALAAVLDHLHPALTTRFFGSILKHVDFFTTNVPGMTRPVYLAGARVDRLYAFAPLMGSAVNVALISYAGTCCIGVTTDTAAVADPDLLLRCFAEAWDEVLGYPSA
ncbi:MAG TPA: wax ester/triacylglycerol synthase family O-acyltransferase [Acidimicrobiia bacterium]